MRCRMSDVKALRHLVTLSPRHLVTSSLPMISTRIDTTGLRRKIAAIRRESPRALDEVDHRVADGVMADVILAAPRDTNRYVRGMAEAANAAGLGPFAVPALRPGKFAAEAKVRLEKQLQKWQTIVSRYERTNRTDKWYQRAVKTRDRAAQELAKWDPYATIIFGGKGRKLEVTVRNKVYGGTGLRLVRAGRVVYVLHNKEAHASIVEGRTRLLKVAMTRARTFGMRLGGRAYARRIAAAADAAGTVFKK